jgi:hypothetical protein
MTLSQKSELPFELAKNEHVIEIWKPKLSIYFLRFSIEPIIGWLIIAPITLFTIDIAKYIPLETFSNILFIVAYIILILLEIIFTFAIAALYSVTAGSYEHWHRNRHKSYYLTNKRLLIIHKRYREDDIEIDLATIRKIKNYFYWKMLILPYGPGVVEAPYLPKVSHVIKTIMHEKNSHQGRS